ncbi:uncharacterized protein LOC131642504 [Vicia villosa]|uniref:uncharacterized protein LOC131642504 n=1 Tax=Vicia villosa TaxID=3911 RepID=UPI00273BDE1E|nr:uncharacterized protein LOC131642504 [Vicia villosa]
MNIRGGGISLKRRRVSSIIKKGKVDILMIQETKIKYFKDFIAKSFLNGSDIGFSFSNSNGASGGLLTLWKAEKLEVVNSFKGEGFLGIKVKWENLWYYVINVYSSCDLDKKKMLWDNLLRLNEIFKDGEWIIGGDFNAIKNDKERRGRASVINQNEARLFAEFIHNSSLVDIPCKGKKFTWYSGDEWNNLEVGGRGDFVLKEKLKLLKAKLKWWNVEVFGSYDMRVEEDVRNINIYDEILESRDEEVIKDVTSKRRDASSRFWRDLQIKEDMLLQKSRLKWLKEGDSNSGFFHKVIEERRRINHIGPILSSRGM